MSEAIRSIRGHLAALGYDFSEYTDEELQAGILRFAEVAHASMFTAREVVNGLAAMLDADKEAREEARTDRRG